MNKIKEFITRPAVRYPVLIVISTFIGFGIYFLNASTVMGNQFPMPFGYGFSVVLTASMEPALTAGDLVIIQEQPSYSPEDIVAYQYGTIGVVHRIESIDGETVITKGDSNNIPDKPIPISAIKGKVTARIPRIGKCISLIKSPIVILGMALLAVLLVDYSFRVDKEKKNAETERLKEEIQRLRDQMNEDLPHDRYREGAQDETC